MFCLQLEFFNLNSLEILILVNNLIVMKPLVKKSLPVVAVFTDHSSRLILFTIYITATQIQRHTPSILKDTQHNEAWRQVRSSFSDIQSNIYTPVVQNPVGTDILVNRWSLLQSPSPDQSRAVPLSHILSTPDRQHSHCHHLRTQRKQRDTVKKIIYERKAAFETLYHTHTYTIYTHNYAYSMYSLQGWRLQALNCCGVP